MTSREMRIWMAAALVVAAGVVATVLFQADRALRFPGVVDVPSAPTKPAPSAPAPSHPDAPVLEPHSSPVSPQAAVGAKPVLVVTVRGMPSGAPVEGADVEVRVGEETVLARAATGADGRARFDGIAVDFVEVEARAPGRVRDRAGVSELQKPGERSITLDLEPGVELGGVVLEAASRRPIPGATVIAKEGGNIGHMSSYSTAPPLMATKSDPDGRFRVDGIPRKEIVTISAESPGFVKADRSLMLGEGAEEHPVIELLLEEATSASGQVTDPEGRAVAGAEVRMVPLAAETDLARMEAAAGPWGTELRIAGSTKTGEDGRFLIDGLRPGAAYRFLARAPGFARSPLSDPPQSGAAGRPILRDLRLRPAATLRVRVVGTDGAALAEAKAFVEMGPGFTLSPEAEGGGVFRFDLLPAGEVEVTGECEGCMTGKESFPILEGETKEGILRLSPAPVEPPPGTGPAMPLPKPGTVRLQLAAPRGTEPPARVNVAVEDTKSGGGTGSTKDWNGGRLEIGEIPPAAARLVVSVEGFAPVVRGLDLAPGETRDLGEITLDLGCELSGRVEDAAGKPLAGARVSVDLPGFMDVALATTGADGRYRVIHLLPGERYVRVAAEGLLDHHEFLALGSGITTCTFSLVPPVKVRGTVKDGEGKPVTEGRVVLLRQAAAVHGIPQKETEYLYGEEGFETAVATGDYAVEVQDKEGRVLARSEASFDGKGDARLDLVIP